MIASGETSPLDVPHDALIIADQAKRMAQIIRQLLDFARKRTPERALTDLASTAEKVVALLGQMADKQGVALSVRQNAEPCVTQSDEGQIQQVLMNVVANAIQATDRGGCAVLALSQRRVQPPLDQGGRERDYCCIEVKDTGRGMDQATIARVFEPFFTTKGIGEGTGLGLSVAYGIVREHGGFIEVESQLGRGSTFTIYLPLDLKETRT
jgi:signal transduction histidine kinase